MNNIEIRIKPSFEFTVYQIPKGDIERWITTETGARVPIKKGENIKDAIKNRAIEKMLPSEKMKVWEDFMKSKLKNIPARHLRGARMEMKKFPAGKTSRTLGAYDYRTNLIKINQNVGVEGLRQRNIIEHELGHHVWRNALTKSQRNKYTDLTYGNEPAVSEYGKLGPGEDFAEAYANFTGGGKRLKRTSSERYRFMRSIFQ